MQDRNSKHLMFIAQTFEKLQDFKMNLQIGKSDLSI